VSILNLNAKKALCQDYIVPGLIDYVKEVHTEDRYYCTLWRDVGKPKFVN